MSSEFCACMLSHFSHVQLFVTLCTVAFQAPLSVRFSRQKYWSGLPCLPPGNLLTQGLNPHLLCLLYWQVGLFFFFFLPLVPRALWSCKISVKIEKKNVNTVVIPLLMFWSRHFYPDGTLLVLTYRPSPPCSRWWYLCHMAHAILSPLMSGYGSLLVSIFQNNVKTNLFFPSPPSKPFMLHTNITSQKGELFPASHPRWTF